MPDYFAGIDIGTSGVRVSVINENDQLVFEASRKMPVPTQADNGLVQNPVIWWQTTQQVLHDVLAKVPPQHIRAISADGTSGTLLLAGEAGNALAPAMMYNNDFAQQQAIEIQRHAPPDVIATSPSSGLAKLLYLRQQFPQASYALHQSDWILGRLNGEYGVSDSNNALKTGYDPISNRWPKWIERLDFDTALLPRVVSPGDRIGQVSPQAAASLGLDQSTQVIAGTTDSVAAAWATGIDQPGQAVTSLGSTMVLKILSQEPVFSSTFGIYSHRYGEHWLAGGASNSGGNVLLKYFKPEQIQHYSQQINPGRNTGLKYYPLSRPGERFPINDPDLYPKLEPRPESQVLFFQAILEGMTRIEAMGYERLQELGAPAPTEVITCGGGSVNQGWQAMRQHALGVPVSRAQHSEASFGSARLAKLGYYHKD